MLVALRHAGVAQIRLTPGSIVMASRPSKNVRACRRAAFDADAEVRRSRPRGALVARSLNCCQEGARGVIAAIPSAMDWQA